MKDFKHKETQSKRASVGTCHSSVRLSSHTCLYLLHKAHVPTLCPHSASQDSVCCPWLCHVVGYVPPPAMLQPGVFPLAVKSVPCVCLLALGTFQLRTVH